MSAKSAGRILYLLLLIISFSIFSVSPGSDYLLFSAEKGHIQNVRRALQTGADINSKDYFGKTCLIHASIRGDKELIQLLLGYGAAATINTRDRTGKSALDYARENGHKKIENILQEYGAKE